MPVRARPGSGSGSNRAWKYPIKPRATSGKATSGSARSAADKRRATLEPVAKVGPQHRHLAPVQAGRGDQAVERVDLGVAAGQRFEGGHQAGAVDVGDEPRAPPGRRGESMRTPTSSMWTGGCPSDAGSDQVRHRLHDHQPEALQDGQEPGQLDAPLAVAADAKGALVAVMSGAHRQQMVAAEGGARPGLFAVGAVASRPGSDSSATSSGRLLGRRPLLVTGRHPGREARGSVGRRPGRAGGRPRTRCHADRPRRMAPASGAPPGPLTPAASRSGRPSRRV